MKKIKKPLLQIIIVCLGMVLFASTLTGQDPNEEVNKLFGEAQNFIDMGQEVEKTSYEQALKHYRSALASLEKITKQYPSSQIAVKTGQEDLKIGPFTVKELKEEIIPATELKVEGEKDPLVCAVLVAKMPKEARYKAAILRDIAVAYAKGGRKEQTLRIASQSLRFAIIMDDPFANKDDILRDIASIYAKAGLYDRALEVTKSISHDFPKSEALGRIASAYAEAGQPEQALKVAKTINTGLFPNVNAYPKAGALGKIAAAYAEAGQKEQASKMFSQALRLGKTVIKDPIKGVLYVHIKVPALSEIAIAYGKIGQKEQASKIISQALQVAQTTKSGYCRDLSLKEIAIACAKTGAYERALQIAETLEDPLALGGGYDKASVLKDIAGAYAKAGEYKQALQVTKTIPIECAYYKAEALGDIAVAYAKGGQKERASEIFSQALQVAQAIKYPDKKASALGDIASGYAKAGQKKRASEIFSQALQTVQTKTTKTIDDANKKALTLGKIAAAYTRAGLKPSDADKQILHEIIGATESTTK